MNDQPSQAPQAVAKIEASESVGDVRRWIIRGPSKWQTADECSRVQYSGVIYRKADGCQSPRGEKCYVADFGHKRRYLSIGKTQSTDCSCRR